MGVVWIISDGKPGHYNQSRAIAEAVRDARGWEIEWVTVHPRYRGSFRPAAYWLTNTFGERLGLSIAAWLFRFKPLPTEPPSLIVSSGGTTAVFNALAAAEFGCPNLFLGPPPLRFDRFSRVIFSEEDGEGPNVVRLPFLPTPVTPALAEKAGNALKRELMASGAALSDEPLWAMLIGGDSRNHRFSDDDWRALAAGMNQLSRRHGGRWLITTSRRTGPAAEALLRQELEPTSIADATWWQDRPRAVVPAYLGASECVFCTQDSLTMLTDGMAAARPVFALYPPAVWLEANGMVEGYLSRHQAAGRIRCIAIDALGEVDPLSPEDFSPLQESIRSQIYEGYVRDILEPGAGRARAEG